MTAVAERFVIGRVPAHSLPARERAFLDFVSDSGVVVQPGLDGLRGFALIAIVGFHLRPSVAPGAAAGLSMFFTLSGFLITTVILERVQRNGRFTVAPFWKSGRGGSCLPRSW
jgi:hypothetical protein